MSMVLETDIGQRYRLVRRIGSGGTGTVYQAADLLLGRPVAIKELYPLFAEEMLREEGRSLARLDHRNVVTLFDFVQSQGQAHLVMEYVDGCDLDRWLFEHGRLDLEHALSLLRTIARGVAHAHGRGLLHCDLKPANVLISTTGEVKLTDFTLARIEGASPDTGVLGATAAWAAPEQMGGSRVDRRTDIHGLGMLLGRILAECDLSSEQGARTAAVAARATAADPNQRFATVEEMLAALPESTDDLTVISAPSTASELTRVRPLHPPPKSGTRRVARKLPIVALPLAALAGVVAIVMHLTASASPARIVLPSLVSSDGRSAQLIARSFNLQTHITQQYSSQIPAGIVIAQSPQAGAEIPRSTVVTIVVSRGPKPVQIPDVNGLQTGDAQSSLTGAGFHVSVQTQEDAFGQPGQVISESPTAGAYALPGATITITVSQAPWWEFWR